MIRNRRVAVGGFPRRIAHVQLLEGNDEPRLSGRLRAEFEHNDLGDLEDEPEHDYKNDPRTDWAAGQARCRRSREGTAAVPDARESAGA